jgi:predicted metal-dependent hydrolase|tara:strand:+ start:160 stop:663 length:504 start_codon:yes stop_codon:yes gene_type:complete
MYTLRYISSYSQQVKDQVHELIEKDNLADYLLNKYTTTHEFVNDKLLREYAVAIKNQYIKKSSPLSQVIYDPKIHVINNALGLHTIVSRVQGNKLKSKNEIRISDIFRKSPEPFLRMIVVHELAHLKEKDHNKAFYKLCCHMSSDYHQLELDMRLYLIQLAINGDIY